MRISEIVNTLHNLPRKKIVILPFEDIQLIKQISDLLPRSSVTIITKQDLAGKGIKASISLLRQQSYDLVIASLQSPTTKREVELLAILLKFAKAQQRYIKINDDSYIKITLPYILISVVPKLILAAVLGAFFILSTEIVLLFSKVAGKQHHPFSFKEGTNSTLLFLRTDLPGALSAGGSISHVKGMIQAFLHAGFRVIYLSDTRVDILPPEVIQVQIKPINFLRIFDEFQLLAYNLQLIERAKSLILKFQPSVIYQRHSIFNFAGGFIARRGNIPLLLEANASEVWAKKHWSRLVFEKLAIRCEKMELQLADKITVISNGVREQLSPYNIEEKRYIYNPNGVDPEEFHPDIDGSEVRKQYGFTDEIVVGFIGTFTRWHGVETLFEAAEIVAKKNPRMRFLFIGEGDLRTALQHRAEEQGLDTTCTFTGLVPHHKAALHLAACDILVSPHLGFEDGTKFFGSPTKLFEYMAMGKAIIASKLEQIGEIITDGVNGFHMAPGNAQQLAELIVQLAHDGALRKRLGAQARQDVINKYTWDKNVERILKSFEVNNP